MQKGEVVYNAEVFLGLVESFADTMVAHLNSVRLHSSLHSYSYLFDLPLNPSQEIPILDRDIIQAHFTIAELKAIDKEGH